jgi:hypothetical protein
MTPATVHPVSSSSTRQRLSALPSPHSSFNSRLLAHPQATMSPTRTPKAAKKICGPRASVACSECAAAKVSSTNIGVRANTLVEMRACRPGHRLPPVW